MHTRILTIPVLILTAATMSWAGDGPKTAHANILNAQGTNVGSATITSTENGVKIAVTVSEMAPGEHGIHIHNVGKCEGPAFTTAGGHFNPTSAHHGIHNTQDPHPHVGDLPNLIVDQGVAAPGAR